MKKIVYLMVLCALGFSAQAQEDKKKENCPSDTNIMNFTNFDLIVVEKYKCDTASKTAEKPKHRSGKFSNWHGLYFGVNGLMTSSGSFDLGKGNEYLELDYSKCMTLGLNFAEIKFKIVPHHVGITTGMGIQWNRYGFKNGYTLSYNNDSIFGTYDSSISLRKNRLNSVSLQIPLLLELKTHKKSSKGIHFYMGGIASYRLSAKRKQSFHYETPGVVNQSEIYTYSKGHYHMNPLIFYATGAIGFGDHVQLFANYGLSELFAKGKGPGVVPFTIGLKIL